MHTYGIQTNLEIGTRTLKQGVYAYRTCPYTTENSHSILHTEDRAFYGTHDEMMNFQNFYTQLPNIFTNIGLIPEMIHTEFLRSVMSEKCIYYQNDIQIVFPPKRTDGRKYKLTDEEKSSLHDRFAN